ncbi:MAG: bifunctional phosphoribosylaminoimidazolecarboxamide formyltransferase/IMP cyclohydrolase [Gammaproteobacteria bacterium]|nr:bifunctional phosphoribosylaminoimidazolecarboxamide formyltransferase/IMP cyclohydrolase [Gammaproteobacteria bacterium]MCY4219330.1 bifunctional phosphoribosylaminoimidazolecarboxamide formyltransferase/IMP cyclohydrolase [Gammaproteobacteria bacterium]
MNKPITRALISVSDKTDLIPFAEFLVSQNIEIISTGGTRIHLAQHNIPVIGIDEYTGFPEIMGGRVKTLHPKIHGGILSRRDEDHEEMKRCLITEIDLVVVNLYPFEKTIYKQDSTFQDAIENIDIGGPTMLRSAAKNHQYVTVITDISDYAEVMSEMQMNAGKISENLRRLLAAKVFQYTSQYDQNIASYLEAEFSNSQQDFASIFQPRYVLKQALRYGENPHQKAAFYIDPNQPILGVSTAQLLQGKDLSYNNIADTDAAINCVLQFDEGPACVIVKHANPCGVALANSIFHAYERAYLTDPESAFGGIIALNCELDHDTASAILDRQFVEVIATPQVTSSALNILNTKPSIRVLQLGERNHADRLVQQMEQKKVSGGILIQTPDEKLFEKLECVTKRSPTEQESQDLLFAWKVAKFVKSNAIVYAANNMTLGIGAGQMSRVNSARIAGIKAEQSGLDIHGAVMSSDAFFPFRDAIDNAAKFGIKAIIQPGGSVRDDEVITAANKHDIAMVFTGIRHFRH